MKKEEPDKTKESAKELFESTANAPAAAPSPPRKSRLGYRPVTVRGGTSPIGEALIATIGNMDSVRRVRESLALAYWQQAVGEQGAAATQTEKVTDGILFVFTKSSVWSHELTLHKDQIIRNLNRMLGGHIVKDIVFKPKAFKKKILKPVELETPPFEELNLVVLEQPEQEELRLQLENLFSLPDEKMRKSLARRITLDAKLRHWRLERGWRICRKCQSLHKTEDAICPLCRLCP